MASEIIQLKILFQTNNEILLALNNKLPFGGKFVT